MSMAESSVFRIPVGEVSADDGGRRRRAASLMLPRPPLPVAHGDGSRLVDAATARSDKHGRSSRRLFVPLRRGDDSGGSDADDRPEERRKGIWNWKPVRALSRIRMHRTGCLFAVEVDTIRDLPPSMNGLRLAVVVRKKETKDGAVQTMPSRVVDGAADFDETLFVKCSLYSSGGGDSGKPIKFDGRIFAVSVVSVDAPELDFGVSSVDLSSLVMESVRRSFQGQTPVRRWDHTFKLYGKAAGGELVARLGFQIMEGSGHVVFGNKAAAFGGDETALVARAQSKSSFSISSKIAIHRESGTVTVAEGDEDFEFPEFEVVDKGVEMPTAPDEREMVKEVVRDPGDVLLALDSIAEQLRALESVFAGKEKPAAPQLLDSDEETLTMKFLKMLELEDEKRRKSEPTTPRGSGRNSVGGSEKMVLVPALGKGLGSVILTRDGGFLISMNPFDVEVAMTDAPKLAMQLSRPHVLEDGVGGVGLEIFRRLVAMGADELDSERFFWAKMDDLSGKTAEQIAFEGVAATIVGGRSRGGADASTSVQVARMMAAAMAEGRKQRILSGIWNVAGEPSSVEEMLAFSLQKLEAMTIDVLKIQAGISDDDGVPPPMAVPSDKSSNFSNSLSLPEQGRTFSGCRIATIVVSVQLRDPSRGYETVGAPMIAVAHAARSADDGELKMASIHVGGLLPPAEKRSNTSEKQRLTALQWLVGNGVWKGKARKASAAMSPAKARQVAWCSVSTRAVADMWLRATRNGDFKVVDFV